MFESLEVYKVYLEQVIYAIYNMMNNRNLNMDMSLCLVELEKYQKRLELVEGVLNKDVKKCKLVR